MSLGVKEGVQILVHVIKSINCVISKEDKNDSKSTIGGSIIFWLYLPHVYNIYINFKLRHTYRFGAYILLKRLINIKKEKRKTNQVKKRIKLRC